MLNAREQLDERFLVISGDVLTDIDLGELVRFHDEAGAVATLALKAMENPLDFGIVITDDQGRIERFLEKPTWGQVFTDRINTGIYVLDPVVLDHIPSGRPVDFSAEVFPELLEAGRPLYGFTTERYWEDVGTLDAYLKAHEDILDGKVSVRVDAFPLREGVWVGEGAVIDPSATIEAPALIGDNCRVGPGVRIGAYSVLGANVRVGEHADIERSVVHDNSYIGPGSADAQFRRRALVRTPPRGEHRRGGGPRRPLPDRPIRRDHGGCQGLPAQARGIERHGDEIDHLGGAGARALFGRRGISGLANVDLSPELVTGSAMAFAATMPRDSVVTTSRDSSRSARMLKRAAMVGLNVAGLHVEDLEAATLPLTRFHIRSSARTRAASPSGSTLRPAARRDPLPRRRRRRRRRGDPEEDRAVVPPRGPPACARREEIGDIDFPARVGELYTAALTSSIELEPLREAHLKLVLDYAHGTASLIMPNVLAKLGADVLVVNPLVSTVGMLGFDRLESAARLSELVRSSGAQLGAVIASDGEQLTLVDDTGLVLGDGDALLAVSRLVAEATPGRGSPCR